MVDLRFAGVVGAPPALLSLKLREKLTSPPRGGAEESTMAQGCCGREGLAACVAAVVCVAARHLNKNKLKNKVCVFVYFKF